jgi:hypothetical protein
MDSTLPTCRKCGVGAEGHRCPTTPINASRYEPDEGGGAPPMKAYDKIGWSLAALSWILAIGYVAYLAWKVG